MRIRSAASRSPHAAHHGTLQAVLDAVTAGDDDIAAEARFLAAVVDALRAGITPEQLADAAGVDPGLLRIIGLNAGWPGSPEARRIERHRLLEDLEKRPSALPSPRRDCVAS